MTAYGTTAIRDSRKRLGLTQQQVAERLGVSRAAVQHYERNEERGVITMATLRAALDVLGGSVSVLAATGDAPRPPALKRLFLDTPQRLAEALLDGRAEAGVTTEELAERAGVSLSLLRDMEAGEAVRDLGAMARVLREVGVSPYALPSMPPKR